MWADDTYRLGQRLTLNLGLRFDHSRASFDAYPILDREGNETGQSTTPVGDLFTWNTFSPRVGVNWRVTADGRDITDVPLSLDAGKFGMNQDAGKYGALVDDGKFGMNTDEVVIVPETPDIYDFYRLADILVCTSFEESFPRVLLEAMVFGTRIVSTFSA